VLGALDAPREVRALHAVGIGVAVEHLGVLAGDDEVEGVLELMDKGPRHAVPDPRLILGVPGQAAPNVGHPEGGADALEDVESAPVASQRRARGEDAVIVAGTDATASEVRLEELIGGPLGVRRGLIDKEVLDLQVEAPEGVSEVEDATALYAGLDARYVLIGEPLLGIGGITAVDRHEDLEGLDLQVRRLGGHGERGEGRDDGN